MREVLIGSAGGCCGAEKQPSDQTRQHQSAPVTRASTIGANIAILPAFTSGQEKRNARPRHRWAGSPIARSIRPAPFQTPNDRSDATRFEPPCARYYSLILSDLLLSLRRLFRWCFEYLAGIYRCSKRGRGKIPPWNLRAIEKVC